MKSRPILFSAPLVRALLSGAKTQTRRVVKFQYAEDVDAWAFDPETGLWRMGVCEGGAHADMGGIRCPYGKPGDTLWVRETWAPCEAPARKGHFQFAADGAVGHHVTTSGGERWWERTGHTLGPSDASLNGVWVGPPSKWRPSIHMPRTVSRLTLEVTGVRVERLNDISEEDAKAEGADRDFTPFREDDREDPREVGYPSASDFAHHEATMHRRYFRSLWESINGADSWAANPWVWAISFRVVTP